MDTYLNRTLLPLAHLGNRGTVYIRNDLQHQPRTVLAVDRRDYRYAHCGTRLERAPRLETERKKTTKYNKSFHHSIPLTIARISLSERARSKIFTSDIAPLKLYV